MGACATLPLSFGITVLAVSFTITMTLVAGFKDEEKKGQLSGTEVFTVTVQQTCH